MRDGVYLYTFIYIELCMHPCLSAISVIWCIVWDLSYLNVSLLQEDAITVSYSSILVPLLWISESARFLLIKFVVLSSSDLLFDCDLDTLLTHTVDAWGELKHF